MQEYQGWMVIALLTGLLSVLWVIHTVARSILDELCRTNTMLAEAKIHRLAIQAAGLHDGAILDLKTIAVYVPNILKSLELLRVGNRQQGEST